MNEIQTSTKHQVGGERETEKPSIDFLRTFFRFKEEERFQSSSPLLTSSFSSHSTKHAFRRPILWPSCRPLSPCCESLALILLHLFPLQKPHQLYFNLPPTSRLRFVTSIKDAELINDASSIGLEPATIQLWQSFRTRSWNGFGYNELVCRIDGRKGTPGSRER